MCNLEFAWWHCPKCKGPSFDPNSRLSFDFTARMVHCHEDSCTYKCTSTCVFNQSLAIGHFHGGTPPAVIKRYYLLCEACQLRQSPEWDKLSSSERSRLIRFGFSSGELTDDGLLYSHFWKKEDIVRAMCEEMNKPTELARQGSGREYMEIPTLDTIFSYRKQKGTS